MADNTIQKDFNDVVNIAMLQNSMALKQYGREMRTRTDQKTQEERQFQDAQQTKALEANAAEQEAIRQHQLTMIDRKGEWDYKSELLTAVGRDSASTKEDNIGDILSIYDRNLKASAIEQDGDVRRQEIARKMDMDESTKNIEKEKLRLKQEELKLKNRQINSQEYIATVNKN